MERQQEIFDTETSELETLINSVSEIADENVRKRWPSTLQSLSEVLNSELKRANIDAPHLADKLTERQNTEILREQRQAEVKRRQRELF